MHAVIANTIGRVHHAAGHPDLSKTRPIYAYVPEEFFGAEGFRRAGYLSSRWPSINAGANPLAVGSHVIPDPARPVCIRSRCPILVKFLNQLAAIAPAKTVA
jgi:hypothetical protein